MTEKNCNDYIIKDGEFVRNFEELYQNIEDPWSQARDFKNDISFKIACVLIKDLISQHQISIKNMLDIGCAGGYQSDALIEASNSKNYFGIDISETVINLAVKDFKTERKHFQTDNIINYNKDFNNKFDFIFSAKTLYYVAPEIDHVLSNIINYLRPFGIFSFVYNQKDGSFSNKWLDYKKLDAKLIDLSFKRMFFLELRDQNDENFGIGIYLKAN